MDNLNLSQGKLVKGVILLVFVFSLTSQSVWARRIKEIEPSFVQGNLLCP
ncbi:MAG: hypothetical protein NC898_03065 [Candidatus Omnitrophica bacterium]|nr:hypothetical protein [Candidatus Omnitrophota bacterium]